MNKLKHILLAGTLVPALAISFVPAFAQAPDQGEHHQKRQHEGGDRAKRGDGEKRAADHDQNGGGAKAKRAEGDEGARGNGRRKRDADAASPGDKAPGDKQGDKAQGRESGASRRESAEGKQERRDKRQLGKEDRQDQRKLGKEDRQDQRQLGKEDRQDKRQLGNQERQDQRQLGKEDRQDKRQLGNQERRDERQLGNQERQDQRQLGREERRDDRQLGREERRDERRLGNDERRGPGGPGGPGFAGGFMAPTTARSLDQLRRDRREVREGDNVFIREPGRTIVQERGRTFIVHDENDRFRALGYDVRRERRGDDFIDTVRRPNGDVILSYTDADGRLLRRVRRGPGGREVTLIENGVGGRIRPYAEDVVVLPPPQVRIPRDRYVVDYRAATPALIYDTLSAPPLAPPPQRYTLDQIRYSPDVRNYVRQVDINSINFDSGSWEVPQEAASKLEALASGMNKAIDRNPDSVFLIEGYTDATGNPNDNLSLSDRRAQSVAEILTKDFKIPPENLTTQGYGQQNPKEDTQGPSAANRRVVVRNITQLMASGGGAPAGQ